MNEGSMGEILKKKIDNANEMIQKGKEELLEVNELVDKNQDSLIKEASLDYQEQTKNKINEALKKEDFSTVARLSNEIQEHLRAISSGEKSFLYKKRMETEKSIEIQTHNDKDTKNIEGFIASNGMGVGIVETKKNEYWFVNANGVPIGISLKEGPLKSIKNINTENNIFYAKRDNDKCVFLNDLGETISGEFDDVKESENGFQIKKGEEWLNVKFNNGKAEILI